MITAEQIVKNKGWKIISVTSETTIKEALEIMVQHKIGSILIKDEGEYKGIWTERDLMRDSLKPGFNIESEKIGDHMFKRLTSVPHSTSNYEMLDRFLGMKLRHLLIENKGVFVGILSVGDVVQSCLNEQSKALKELNQIINWEYYENWKW